MTKKFALGVAAWLLACAAAGVAITSQLPGWMGY
jgi:hypothetical protein